MPKVHQFSVRPQIPARLRGLEELAFNLRWTWDTRAFKVFQHLDAALLEKCSGNPVTLLRRISRERLEQAAQDPAFLTHLDEAVADLHRYLAEPGWFQLAYPDYKNLRIAYFCMEFGLTHCLPIYSGGLGVLAGDHLKAASTLNVPLVGVGLLYNRGHFTQSLDDEYWQNEEYCTYDPINLPVVPVLAGETWRLTQSIPQDEPPSKAVVGTADSLEKRDCGTSRSAQLKVPVEMGEHQVWARVWKAQVGRVSLYLLDSVLPENDIFGQRITGELYGGGTEDRLAQELLLGIGGIRALREVDANPQVLHINEGHTVFSCLERVREFMETEGVDFYTARLAAGAGTLFTTHTTVPAGFDLFPQPLIESYLGDYLPRLGLETEQFMRMGRAHPDNVNEDFNVAVLALRHSPRRNAVSRLHRRVAARMMSSGWPGFPLREIPIESVTNGIHTRSWIAPEMAQLFDHYLGPRWREDTSSPEAWQRVERIPDVELWHARSRLRERLVAYAREQALELARKRQTRGAAYSQAHPPLRPDTLTIGFARRFATYKRADLLFHDIDRLKSILLDKSRPVQLIITGKAHPRDGAGKDLLRRLLDTVNSQGLSEHVVFLEDYDMAKAAMLVQGADVWLNTPRRPFEACGTSGMKIVTNGGLNLSVLDGWWAEAYRPGVGWAIGDGQEFVHADYQDEIDAECLYALLEQEVVPLFYDRDADALPREWIAMMKDSIRFLAPVFSGDRMMKQYTERFYLPLAERYQRVTTGHLTKARELSAWRARVKEAWCEVKVTCVQEQSSPEITVGQSVGVTARVRLGSLDPADVTVEVCTGRLYPDGSLRSERATPMTWAGYEDGEHIYRGMAGVRTPGQYGYYIRVLPYHEDVLIPNELSLITREEQD